MNFVCLSKLKSKRNLSTGSPSGLDRFHGNVYLTFKKERASILHKLLQKLESKGIPLSSFSETSTMPIPNQARDLIIEFQEKK